MWDETETIRDVEELGEAYDEAVLATPGISTYCTSRDWALAAATHLHPGREPWIVHRDGYWLALTRNHHPQVGAYFQPLEGDWGFCSPLLGADYRHACELVVEALEQWEERWQVALLHGLDFQAATALALALDRRYRVALRDGIRSRIASLDGGMDAFMGRRSKALRHNLRRDARRCAREGLRVEVAAPEETVDELFARILAVEERSWKHATGQSVLASERYRAFYKDAMTRAAQHGGVRAAFARTDDRDVGYVFGGVVGAVYRGFQLGYDTTCAHLGVGNQVQLAMIEALCNEGVATYDLGMEMSYKSRWAERVLALHTLVVVNPSSNGS